MTRVGQYVVLGAVATGVAGGFPGHMVGSYAFSFFAAFIVLSFSISLLRRPGVAVERRVPGRCMVGASVPLSIRITNEGRRAVYDVGAYEFRLPPELRLGPEPRYIDRLGPGHSHTFEYTLHAARRGRYTLPGPTTLSAFPFALTNAKQITSRRRRLTVYPAFRPLGRLDLPDGASRQPSGAAPVNRLGESMEFIGIREYRPGDRVRDLHPRSWARLGQPVVKQYADEHLTRVALLVDTHTPRHRTAEAGLEANLSLAAAVADYLTRRSHVIDLFAAGPDVYPFSAGRPAAQLDPILDLLAGVRPSRSDPLKTAGPIFQQRLRSGGTVVLLLVGWDGRRRQLLESLREAGAQVKAVALATDRAQAEAAHAAGCTVLSGADVEHGVEEV